MTIEGITGFDPSGNGDPGNNCAGNPINLLNGNKYQEEIDYQDFTWLDNNVALNFTRYFNSNINFLTGITDETNKRYATWTYDGLGRAISSTHAHDAGKVVAKFSSTSTTLEVTTETGIKRDISYNYTTTNGKKRLTSIRGSAGRNCALSTAGLRYDSAGRIHRKQDHKGFITEYAYDQGRVSQIKEGLSGILANPSTTADTRTREVIWNFDVMQPAEIHEYGVSRVFTYENGLKALPRIFRAYWVGWLKFVPLPGISVFL